MQFLIFFFKQFILPGPGSADRLNPDLVHHSKELHFSLNLGWHKCCGYGMFIPDPESEFVTDPGSKRSDQQHWVAWLLNTDFPLLLIRFESCGRWRSVACWERRSSLSTVPA